MALGLLLVPLGVGPDSHAQEVAQAKIENAKEKEIKKILFIGDSMTGWLSERLNAYGQANGFEVATIVWDGSTFGKWASAGNLVSTIDAQNPDAVFISLGMNELFEANPSKLQSELDKIRAGIGNRPFIWVGPPSWPGQNKGAKLNDWLQQQLGEKSFFRSFDLTLPRQSARNPHPTREGMIRWMDSVVDWIKSSGTLPLNLENAPGASQMSRGKTFIYKRMNENL